MNIKQFAVACLLALLSFNSPKLIAYDLDVHFHVIYTISRDCGCTHEEALLYAQIAQYVDEHNDTLPSMQPWKDEQRRKYHFPCAKNLMADYTKRNSCFANYNAKLALMEKNEIYFGLTLHVLQDSYSHESFGPVVGHAKNGHDPDRPHLGGNTTKSIDMTRRIYTVIREIRKQLGKDISERKILSSEYKSLFEYNPGQHWYESYEKEIGRRAKNWNTFVKGKYNQEISYRNPTGTNKEAFEKIIKSYVMPKTAGDCFDAEDSRKSSTGIGEELNSKHMRSRVVTEKIIEKVLKKKIKFVVKFAIANPEVIKDERIQAQICTVEGLNELMTLSSNHKYAAAAIKLIEECGWSEDIDYFGIISGYMDSEKAAARLTAANLLYNQTETPEELRVSAIEAFKSVDIPTLKTSEKAIFASQLPATSDFVDQWEQLFGDPKLADQSAAALYKISNNEPSETLSSQKKKQITDSRSKAVSILRQGTTAKLKDKTNISYWQNRTYEDFDNDLHNSEIDKTNLAKLNELLNLVKDDNDISDDDLTHLQALAIACASYDTRDNVSEATISLLKELLDKITDSTVKWQIGYALENITGISFDLTTKGLAGFDRQWQKKYLRR